MINIDNNIQPGINKIEVTFKQLNYNDIFLTIDINIKYLKNGIYNVQILSNGGSISKQLIKF